ncbi:MAG: transcriptional regulator, MarR family [Acidobacteriaceae bacterium]|nr:transcriptional regulator, MarR family [Acidobacteriaceae bacterium]
MKTINQVLPDLPCACATVRRASRLVTQLYGSHLRDHGLEASQLSILSFLNAQPGKSQVALASVLGFDKTTLSRNLKLLQKNGWVKSAKIEGQKELVLHLTRAGQRLVKSSHADWQKAQTQLQSAMTSAEWDTMWKGLRILTQSAHTANL